MKWLILFLVPFFWGCGIFDLDEEPKIKVWVEEIPDSLLLWDPVEWHGVNFRARQNPPDTIFWKLEWFDVGITIDAGAEMPGSEVVQPLYFPQTRFRAVFLFFAWGPHTKADTALWVEK